MFINSRDSAAVDATLSELPRHSWAETVAWHLLPGVPIAIIFGMLAYWFQQSLSLPNVYALFVTVTFVEIPLLYWLIRKFRCKPKESVFSSDHVMPLRVRQPAWVWLAVGIPVMLYSFVANAMVAGHIDNVVLKRTSVLLPDWYVLDFSGGAMTAVRETSPNVFFTFWLLSVIGFVGGSYMQELYFRGVLLPRMPDAGIGTPLANAALFSVFHLTSPWALFGRLLFLVPWSLIVWWRKSLNLGILMHVGMAVIGGSVTAYFLFSN